MSLTPALCASLLTPVEKGHHLRKAGFFGWFNRGFAATRKNYEGFLARMISKIPRYLVVYLAIIVVVGWLYYRLPSSFLPSEDQGYFITSISLPVGATQQRAVDVLKQVESYYLKQPEVAGMMDMEASASMARDRTPPSPSFISRTGASAAANSTSASPTISRSGSTVRICRMMFRMKPKSSTIRIGFAMTYRLFWPDRPEAAAPS